MYPRNAASPERIAIGPVLLIADGTVQTAGVTVRIIPFGGSEADGLGTTAYSTDGVVLYTPTQAETNYTSFVLIAKKSACIPANVTVVTSARSVSGEVQVGGYASGQVPLQPTTAGRTLDVSAGGEAGIDLANIGSPNTTVNLSGVTIKTATDLETDTQDIQSRLPAALVDGRIVANAQVVGDKTGYTATVSDKTGFSLLATTGLGNQTADITGSLSGSVGSVTGAVGSVTGPVTVGDKTGFKLAADGLALITAWTVGITGNLTGNLTGSVGSISGVTFPTNFGNLGIEATGEISTVATVDELGPSALSANSLEDQIAASVASTQVLTRLDSMIESDGSGQFRFDTIALEMAPTGGGGGGGGGHTDWTASERTAIRAILGIPASGTTPTDPTTGILDEIRDSIGGQNVINVYPVSASTPERVAGTTITYYRNEIRTVSVVTDFTLANLTLVFTVEDAEGTDILTIADGLIGRSDQTFTVSIGTAVTATISNYRWALRDITGGSNSVIARGVLTVQEAASA